MATATLDLGATAPVSKIDATDWTRELWLEAYAMARRMIRDGAGHGTRRRLRLVPRPRPPPVRRQRLEDRPGRRPGRLRPPHRQLRGHRQRRGPRAPGLVRRTRRPRPRQPDGHRPLPCRVVRAAARHGSAWRGRSTRWRRPTTAGCGSTAPVASARSAGRSWPRLEAEERLTSLTGLAAGLVAAGLAADRVALRTPSGSRTSPEPERLPGRAIRPGYFVRITQASRTRFRSRRSVEAWDTARRSRAVRRVKLVKILAPLLNDTSLFLTNSRDPASDLRSEAVETNNTLRSARYRERSPATTQSPCRAGRCRSCSW